MPLNETSPLKFSAYATGLKVGVVATWPSNDFCSKCDAYRQQRSETTLESCKHVYLKY